MAFTNRRTLKRAAAGAVRFAFLFLLLAGSAVAGRLIPVDDAERALYVERRAERWLEVREQLRAPGATRRAATTDAGGGRSPLRVMVCLLAFEENREPGLTTVPPDGGFMLDPEAIPEWQRRVDPPPHDRAYFDAHMSALSEYMRFQSYGKVEIEWDLLPAEGGPFLMSDIADYGPGEGGYWTLELLESFMREALDGIDGRLQADPVGPRFADYDIVMIFHAGSDLQNDIALDSPNDLPSFNIFFGDPDGPHPVDGGETLLGSVLLLPETTIQDVEEGDALGALNAVTAHEFTHQLGTVDTYNTYWFWPVVGYWDLMDSGHQLTMGLQTEGGEVFTIYGGLPTSLAVWHKEYLGWIGEEDGSLLRLPGGERDVTLTAAEVMGPGVKALRVDLSDSEYFLFENRQELVGTQGRYIEQDDDTGVILYVADWVTEENLGEYDLFVPQSGLLAWHVAEQGLDELWDINYINPDGDRHFWLTEADGLSDLGNPYSWDWRGSETDPFYTGNNTGMGPLSTPSTRLKDKTPSGFTMSDLVTSPYLSDTEAVDSTIAFHVSLSGPAEGFPRDDRDLVPEALDLYAAPNGLVPLGEDGLAYALTVLDPDSSVGSRVVMGGLAAEAPIQQPLPSFAGRVLSSGVLPDYHEGQDAWIVFTADSLHAYLFDEDGEGLWLWGRTDLSDPILAGPAIGQDYAFWIGASGAPYQLDAHRAVRTLPASRDDELVAYSPPTLWRGHGLERILLQLNVFMFVIDPYFEYSEESPVPVLPLPEGREGVSWIRSLDTDGDGNDEVFWIERSGFAGSWDSQPIADVRKDPVQEQAYFQFPLDGDSLLAGPAVGDMDADGVPELFLSTRDRVYRFATTMHPYFPAAQLYGDWPLRTGEMVYLDDPMRVGGAVLLADMTGDGASELILFGDRGHLLVADEHARPVLGTPRSLAGEAPADLYAVNGKLRAASWKGYLLGFDGEGDGADAEWGLAGGGPGRDGRWERRHAYAPQDAEPEASEWVIYPNPAMDELKLHHPSAAAGLVLRMELYDLEGQRKLEGVAFSAGGPFEASMDLGDLASGVYLLRAELVEDGESRYHFIKSVAVLK